MAALPEEEAAAEAQSWTAEPQADSAALDTSNIDASWAEAAEADSGSMVDATPESDGQGGEAAAEAEAAPSAEADSGELVSAQHPEGDEVVNPEAETGPVEAVSSSAMSPVTPMESVEEEGEPCRRARSRWRAR